MPASGNLGHDGRIIGVWRLRATEGPCTTPVFAAALIGLDRDTDWFDDFVGFSTTEEEGPSAPGLLPRMRRTMPAGKQASRLERRLTTGKRPSPDGGRHFG